VVAHRRDCDGTPLYSLSPHSPEDENEWNSNKHTHGYPEDSLVVIRAAS
jgi:hypothetical protein